MESKAFGELKGIVTDKNGNPKLRFTLKDVVFTPQSQFNLLSLTKLMREGWELRGSSHDLMLSKGNTNFNFDAIIKTPKGKLFCVNI